MDGRYNMKKVIGNVCNHMSISQCLHFKGILIISFTWTPFFENMKGRLLPVARLSVEGISRLAN